ncbi:MAG: choice-of-anchor Q domain-containing protein [Chloroflexota bacterium]
MENSLFLSNNVYRVGWSNGGGGGIAVFDAQVKVTNTTFYGNTSFKNGGAIAISGSAESTGAITLTNVTIAGGVAGSPGSAIAGSLPVILRNTIISNNSGAACDAAGHLVDGGGNLHWPANDTSCVGMAGDPKLQSVEYNGNYEYVRTMALGAGSAALNLGLAYCPAADQRGLRRWLAPAVCDAGAYEQRLARWMPVILNGTEQ